MAWAWSDVTTGADGKNVCRKVVFDSGTETTAPSAATDGVLLEDCSAYDLVLEAATSQTLSGAGTIQTWFYDYAVGGWARAPDFDITVPAGVASIRRYYPLAGSPGKGVPVLSGQGRVAFTITGVTVSGGALTLYVNPIGA